MIPEVFFHAKGMNQNNIELLVSLLQKFLDTSQDMIFVKDLNLTYLAGTQSFAEMMGKSSIAEVLGHTDDELLEDKELAKRYIADDRRLLKSGKDLIDYIEPLTDKDGQARYSSTSKHILRDDAGNAIGIFGIGRDITGKVRASQMYHQVVECMFNLPEDTLGAVLIDVTDWRLVSQSQQEFISELVPQFGSLEGLLSSAVDGIYEKQSRAYDFYCRFSQEYLSDMFKQGKPGFEVEYERQFADGLILWVRDEWTFLANPENGNLTAMLTIKDISSRKQTGQMAQTAQTDELTGLYNCAAVTECVQSYLEGEGANGSHAAFIISLDDFKQVNDAFGYQTGDMLLSELAANIRKCFREADILGRMGGVEFFALAKNVPNRKTAMGRAGMVQEVLRDACASHIIDIGTISIGIGMYPADGKTMEVLYQKADEALHQAKKLDKNRVAFSTVAPSGWDTSVLDGSYEAYNSQVVDHSGSLGYICDLETYDLLHLTKAAMALHGMTSPEKYRGKKCYQVIAGLDQPCPHCTNVYLAEGMEYRWEHYNNKVQKWFDRTSSIIRLNGRRCHLEIGRDITARKEELSLLSGQLTMEDVLFSCLHTLTNEKDTKTAFQSFLEAIGGYYQADRAYIFEFDLANQLCSNTFEWCAPGVSAEIDNLQQLPIAVVERWNYKFEAEGAFSISSVGKEVDPSSEEYRILEMQGIRSLMAAPLRDENRIVGFVGVDDPLQNQGNLTLLRSVSEFVQAELERRRLLENLANALNQANSANQAKSAFLFNMSHDIRTPMNAILGFSMMAEKHIDEKERALDSLAKLNSAGKHLLRLINNVLDMSRIESGKMAVDLQPHHFPTLLKETQELFAVEMQKKDVMFTVSWEIEDEFVLMDRLRMDQVKLNLLSNALKYTPEGGRVDYSVRQIGRTDDGMATYQLSVKDTGIGMSEEFVAHVFEPFEREKTSTVNGIQGTGLGLAIVKSLIEQMDGTITCKSKQGVGTEFVATVTLQTVTEEALPRKVDEMAPQSSFMNKRILLVEDNELNREIAVEILEEFGFIMEAAEDGDIAVDMVKKSEPGHYDLILMDIQMPRMNGYTATREIRALENKSLSEIPIIAMTANAFAEDRQNAMAAGMNEHIAKPIDVPKLIEILQRVL